MIYPSHLQIETVNGLCTARCTMCSINSWTRKPRIIDMDTYTVILNKFLPYKKHFQYLSLQGFGETLIDKLTPAKIEKASKMGFRGIGFATNCTNLTIKTSHDLICAGIDTLICSIDGATKETHEAIRVGTNYDKVVENVINFMNTRRYYDCKTKVIIRFIRQKANKREWKKFKSEWEKGIDPKYGDAVVSFDIVDCDSKVKEYKKKDVLAGVTVPMVCDQINNRIIVLSNGDVALCCGDDNGKFDIGNVLQQDPMEIYNSGLFEHYRTMMKEGRIGELDICKGCTIPRSEERKDRV